MHDNPYLKANRLQDVLAAIQFLANYYDYDLTESEFREKIAGDPQSAQNWGEILLDHQEFFRKSESGGDFSLVLRRVKEKDHAGRRPSLSTDELNLLVNTAVNLQMQALEIYKERRAWLPIAASILGAVTGFAGAVLGALIGAK